MKAAIYSRKSKFTGKGESIENQIEMCKEYGIKNLNIEEFIVYEDEGFSGGNTNRPQFQQLLKDAKAKKFDALICYRLDRISRNVSDFSTTLELLEKYDINFVSIKEQFDTSTPMGKAMIYIASVFAQLERETIAERVRDNMLELAKSGRWLGGQTPLGFESEQIIYMDEEFKERYMYRLSPVDDELTLVKLVFQKYLEFKSLRKVNQYLLQNNFKTKLGADWNVRSVSDLLQNPTYVRANESVFNYLRDKGITCVGSPDCKHGILTYNKKKGQTQHRSTEEWVAAIAKHEGIIDADKWLEIQSTLKANKSKAPRLGKTHNALLTGILRCGKCGSPMTVVHGSKDKEGNRRFYYSCSMKIDSKGTRCDNQNINSKDVEEVVIRKLKESTKDTGKLIKELTSIQEEISMSNDNKYEIELLNKNLAENQNAIKNLIKQLSENSNSAASKYIISEIEEREISIKEINDKLNDFNNIATQNNNYKADISLIIENLKVFYKLIDTSDTEQKKHLISMLVDKITWDGSTGDIDIQFWGSPKKK